MMSLQSVESTSTLSVSMEFCSISELPPDREGKAAAVSLLSTDLPRRVPAREPVQPLPPLHGTAGHGELHLAGGDQAQPVPGGAAARPQTWRRHLDVQTDRLHLLVRLQVLQGGAPRLHTPGLAPPPHSQPRAEASGGVRTSPSLSPQKEKLDNSTRLRC